MIKRTLLCMFALPFSSISLLAENEPISIEFKIVHSTPSADRDEHILERNGAKLFAENTVLFSTNDIASATLDIQVITLEQPPNSLIQKIIDKLRHKKPETKTFPRIKVTLKGKSEAKLYQATSQNIGKQMGVFIDGELISAPVIMDAIPGRDLLIVGSYTKEEMQEIVNRINKTIELKNNL